MATVKVLINAEERVQYSCVVEIEESKFHEYERRLGGSNRDRARVTEEVFDVFIDRKRDWQDDDNQELTDFMLDPNDVGDESHHLAKNGGDLA